MRCVDDDCISHAFYTSPERPAILNRLRTSAHATCGLCVDLLVAQIPPLRREG